MDCTDGRGGINAAGRIALALQYDGTRFNGWQVQENGRTVQGELERALEILLRRKARVAASGRTDTGVHALGQVAHFECDDAIGLQRLCIALNGILDRDVSVLNAYRVPPGFHARFSAVRREYIFLIYNNSQRSPFARDRAMWVREPLDLDYLRKASSHLVGEKDFMSFCKKTSSDVNTVRRIDEIELTRSGDLVRLRILGNAFLHNMIRIIVGTLLEMHRGGVDPSHMGEILRRKDRDSGGVTVPPWGLYLNRVFYEPALESMEKAF
jgi:tRNA pseudouridine38-40 synthase